MSFGIGKEEGLAFNRRYHMLDGTVGWNPGKKNPKIVRPAGPTDPCVPVVLFETTDKTPKPIAIYVNFAMHLDTVGGLYYSADYPFTLSKALAAVKGEDAVTVFTTGTCGDINHVNVNDSKPQKGDGEAARIGTRLAGEVLRTFDKLKPASDGPLRGSSAMVELALPPVTPDEMTAAKHVIAELRAAKKPAPSSSTRCRPSRRWMWPGGSASRIRSRCKSFHWAMTSPGSACRAKSSSSSGCR